MPYAPGIQAQAGEYFSQVGPRLAQNLQDWRRNREERQQTTATAEMIGRYLKDDPQALELFGEQLSKVPSMSTGAAKGVIGGAAMYMADKVRKAQIANYEADNRRAEAQLALSQQAAALKADDARKLARYNQLIAGHFNRPANVQVPFAAPPPSIDAATLTRYAGESGVAGSPHVDTMINALQRYGAGERDRVPEEMDLAGRKVVFSRGTGAFQVLPNEIGGGETPTAQAIRDEKGNIISFGIPTGKGGFQLLPKDKGVTTLTPAQRGTVIKTRAEIAEKLRELRTQAEGVTGPEAEQYQRDISEMEKAINDLNMLLNPPAPAGPAEPVPLKAAFGDLRQSLRGDDVPAQNFRPAFGDLRESLRGEEAPVVPDAEVAGAVTTQPGSAMEPTPEPAKARVTVVAPDGKRGTIPASQVEVALKKGYRLAQ